MSTLMQRVFSGRQAPSTAATESVSKVQPGKKTVPMKKTKIKSKEMIGQPAVLFRTSKLPKRSRQGLRCFGRTRSTIEAVVAYELDAILAATRAMPNIKTITPRTVMAALYSAMSLERARSVIDLVRAQPGGEELFERATRAKRVEKK